jgi:hypothetical protein
VYVNSTVVDLGYLGLSLFGYGGNGGGDVDVAKGDLISRTKMSWVRGFLILRCGDGMGQGCECGSCEEWGLISQDARWDGNRSK